MRRVARALRIAVVLGGALTCDNCTRSGVREACIRENCIDRRFASCAAKCSDVANRWQAQCEEDSANAPSADDLREQAEATYGGRR